MSDRRAELDALKRDRAALVRALEDAGATVNGSALRCPFHDDERASGGIHQKDGVWFYTCHGCAWNGDKRSGDVLDVVRRSQGVDFKGALHVLGVEAPHARRSGGNGAPCDAAASGDGSGSAQTRNRRRPACARSGATAPGGQGRTKKAMEYSGGRC
ncbi:MAG: hypothetical protein KAY37_16005 [Phycisphaerae bacterium]|nr:hypothetical protein [Phycisphaerae bacterium]